MINTLPDFKEELTLLQFQAKKLGVSLLCSPKYHLEIAGEGCSKNAYRRFSMKDKKKSKEEFQKLVSKSINTQENMTPARIWSLCHCHLRYILAYLALEKELHCRQQSRPNTAATNDDDYTTALKGPEMSLSLIERVVKKYKKRQKCHRNILDSESKFLNDVVNNMWKQTSLCHDPDSSWKYRFRIK